MISISELYENGNFHTSLQNFKVPDDYKFHCFGDEIFVQVDKDRFINHTRTIFDAQWQKMPFTYLYSLYTPKIDKPKNFILLKEIARKLCGDFAMMRVDTYCINYKVYIGELTFTPEGGTGKFTPNEWDAKLGSLWYIEN